MQAVISGIYVNNCTIIRTHVTDRFLASSLQRCALPERSIKPKGEIAPMNLRDTMSTSGLSVRTPFSSEWPGVYMHRSQNGHLSRIPKQMVINRTGARV